MPPPDAARRSILLVLTAAAIWGLGFVATQATLASLHPLWSNALRFALAAPVALVVFRRRITWDRAHLQAALGTSVLLTAAFTLQTWGLGMTSVARSSLITGLYAVITPLIAPLFRAPRPNWLHGVAAAVAVAGLAVLGRAWDATDGGLNKGDLLTLGCAFGAAAHIHAVGRVAPGRDPFALNALQMLWAALFTLVAALLFGGPAPQAISPSSLWPLLYLATFSSVAAFGIQMRAQQTLSPSTAGTLLLMETPFGILFGVLLVGEQLTAVQLLGAAILLAGCVLSVRADSAVAATGRC